MLVLRTLGSLELVSRAGRTLRSVRQDKRLALLIYLATNDPVVLHRRDKLLALFWPELDEDRARHALRQSLYYLRDKLGPATVVTQGEDVAVGRVWCDANALRDEVTAGRWAEAAALYRGDFLEGFHVTGLSSEFEEWLLAQRRRLRQLGTVAATSLTDDAERNGDVLAAAEAARLAIRIDPLDERLVRRLIAVLDRQGERAGAIEAYERYAATLREDYELEPAPETTALIAAVRARRNGVKAVPPPPGPELAAAGGVTESSSWPPAGGAAAERQGEPAVAAVPAASGRTTRPWRWPAPWPWRGGPTAMPPAATRERGSNPFQIALLVVAILNVLVVAGIALRSPPPGATAPTRRLAVLPFGVSGAPGFDFLREGLVELVNASLADREIIGVPAAIVLRRAGGESGRRPLSAAEQAELARRLGADLVLSGEAVVNAGTVRIRGTIFDARALARLRTVEVSGETAQVGELAQRLAAAVTRGRAHGGNAPTAPKSLAALKFYVLGQRLLSEHRYEPAMAAFQASARADTTFASAFFGLATSAEAAQHSVEADAAAMRALSLADRLPERERNLLAARASYRAGDAAAAERFARAVLARYGDDTDAWSILGETRIRLNPLRGRPAAEARQAFERVLALEPTRRDAAYHLVELAALRGDWPAVIRLGRSAAVPPTHPRARQIRLLTRAAEAGGRVDSAAVEAELAGANDEAVLRAARTLAVNLGDLPAAIRALGPLEEPTHPTKVRAYAAVLLAQLELAQGRWTGAEAHLGRVRAIDAQRAAAYEALLATAPGLPHDRARLRAARRHLAAAMNAPQPLLADSADWSTGEGELAGAINGLIFPYLDGRLGALLGDGTAPARLSELNQQTRGGALADHYALILRAALDPTADPLPSGVTGVGPDEALLSPFFSLPDARFAHADRLARSGEPALAMGWLVSLEELSIPDLVFAAPAHLRQAQMDRVLGRPREAAFHYRAFLGLWRECDPELRPVVQEARRALATLIGS